MDDILTEKDTKSFHTSGKHGKPVNSLKKLIKSHKLSDIWRELNPNITQYTWKRIMSISS